VDYVSSAHATRLFKMQRILIVGQSGTGKSTMARMLSDGLGLPWHCHDRMHLEKSGEIRSPAEVNSSLTAAIQTPKWVLEGNRVAHAPQAMAHADTLIWLDYDLPHAGYRFAKRSIRRLFSGEQINGQQRGPGYSFTQMAKDVYWNSCSFMRDQKDLRTLYEPLFNDATQYPHLQKVRLSSPTEAAKFMKNMGMSARPTPVQKRDARCAVQP